MRIAELRRIPDQRGEKLEAAGNPGEQTRGGQISRRPATRRMATHSTTVTQLVPTCFDFPVRYYHFEKVEELI